ncbi:capsule assembly Wzi family protein [Olivibacter domesticus]|uniref:Capsule assembly protein Wzi n=1 Tax=Olivibacter domesticus TaxID=407022 RepID=A0A1H7UYH1_OLID1|nr:capsule assembly Wzi family protein [Olivibacter domesticus]SEM01819.1 Capsule assembly protein Wzi [Olivibacter domesticus]
MRQYIRLSLIILLLGSSISLRSQVLPVGTPVLEDYYRRQQLLGKLDSTVSFSVRPLTNQVLKQRNIFNPDSSYTDNSIYQFPNGKGFMQVMPAVWQNQLASAFPYGWNDGGMIPAVGYQTMLSAGVYAEYKWLSIQLRPEFVFAQNRDYQGYEGRYESDWRLWWNRIGNQIDAPERFGTGSYTKFLPGQSSVRLNFHPISIGISTENLWWGPGMRNSLLMSNSAPGFLHATINTTRPIRTPIGSFEGQMVGGRLKTSGFSPKPLTPDQFSQYYNPKPDDWRYFSGIVLSYQPKWVPGLTLGLTRAFTVYSEDMGNKLGDYIPFFQSGSKASFSGGIDSGSTADAKGQDQLVSFFLRWVIPEAQFEIYGEYGRNDHPWNGRDLTVMSSHSRAYTFGLRKLIDLQNYHKDLLQINFEMTQMSPGRSADIRPAGTWYRHYQVRDGYTNLGQIMGAGMGLGNDVQALNVSILRGMKQVGVQFERMVHNNDFFYSTPKDMRANWVDFGMAANGVYDYKNFLFTGKIQYIHANNYQYQYEEKPELENFWRYETFNKTNWHLQLGAMYRF